MTSVKKFIAAVENDRRRNDALALLPAAFLDSIPMMGVTPVPTFVGGVLVTEIYLWHSYRQTQT